MEELSEDFKELLPFLPEDMQTIEELLNTFRYSMRNDVVNMYLDLLNYTLYNINYRYSSPQLKSSLRALSSALMGDDINSIFANFGLNPKDAMNNLNLGNGIGAFLDAILAQGERDKKEKDKK